MKTTAYTPGPWKFDETWALIKGPNGEEVAAIHSGVADDTQRQQRPTAAANARLIAMAPELAEALRRLVKAMRYMRKTMEDELEMEDAVKLLARADGFFCDGSWRADESEAGK